MSKARGSSLKRKISRGTKGREKGITTEGRILFKEPRIITEFVETFGKLIILKRSNTGHNQKRKTQNGKIKRQRPYYQLAGTV